jgi:two-component system, chemotaxis family, sensor kinase CheA
MSRNEKYDINKALKIFFIESREMLDTMESCLLTVEKEPHDDECINALFRSVHSIKGSSGMFNFTEIEKFTHKVENILDDVRKNIIIVDEKLIGILLECHDYINKLIDEYENDNNAAINENLKDAGSHLIAKLSQYKTLSPDKDTKFTDSSFGITNEREIISSQDKTLLTKEEASVSSKYWHISLRYGKDVFRHGLDPRSFISYLENIGKVIKIITITDGIPPINEIDPENCYLGFEILMDDIDNKKAIDEVFDFVKDDCEIRILSPGSKIIQYVKLLDDLPETPMRIGEILVEIGCLTQRELELALKVQESLKTDDIQPQLGGILLNEKMIQQPVLDAALDKQKEIIKAEEKKSKSIRIDAEKLDELINIVGELVITSASVRQISERMDNTEMVQPMLTMSRLVEDVRDRIMNIRMVQIGDTFKRFERVVRDLSRDSGKEADLVVNGGDTELDKTIIEKITDPIMHLIRNSLDHGIDKPDDRIRKGKPGRGSITLNAYHETGSIVIEIKDDGNGLNRAKIRKKAVELGFIKQDQSIEDQELYQYIFEPGFSTAEKITNISGRGVGMDVVKKNIESLRGSVVLESEEGAGMTTRIHLPLTLAIIDGFLVQVSGDYFVLPLDLVSEVFDVTHEELMRKEGANIINLRGEVLPFMRLRDFFNEAGNESASENVLVVEYARKKAGLVVDKLVGEFQTVIKPLGKLFTELQWISGATILGNGDVAFILDVPRLIQSNKELFI